jgi:hypothetical protein
MERGKEGTFFFVTFMLIGVISYFIMLRNDVEQNIANIACFPIAVIGTFIVYGIKQIISKD